MCIGNLEMPLSRRGYRVRKHSNLRSDPERADDVRSMGIDAVSLANNHMMDYGPEALFDTLEACDRAGLVRCGAGRDLEDALRPAWLRVGPHDVALVSVSATLPMESEAGVGKPGIAPLRVACSFEVDANLMVEQPGTMPVVHTAIDPTDQDTVCHLVAELKGRASYVILAVHWGVPTYWMSPYQGLLAEYQTPLAHALIDAGADLICGHHSHSLHPIEVYRGKPIFYSLGNFMFETARGFMEPESLIVSIRPSETPSVELRPLSLDENGIPGLAEDAEAQRVLKKVMDLSAPFGTDISVRESVARLELRDSALAAR
jgi:poly-gamma-glutamate capsule biosynthesis protein CapA/YwtB (metallophosphatase superfamily)